MTLKLPPAGTSSPPDDQGSRSDPDIAATAGAFLRNRMRMKSFASWCWSNAATLPRTVVFLFAATVMLVYNLGHVPDIFYYDSGGYWDLGQTFTATGEFDLRSYGGVHRGYAFPLFNAGQIGVFDWISVSHFTGFMYVSAFGYAALFTLVWPWIIRALFNYRMNSVQVLGWFGLTMYFWRGHFLYPLSDFPALFLILTAVTCIKKFVTSGAAWWLLGAGSTMAFAANVRPSYQLILLPLLILLGVMVVLTRDTRRGRSTVAGLALLFVGLAGAFAPQSYINDYKFDTRSPFVQTKEAYADGNSLFLQQLVWGMYMQRYETNVGESPVVPIGRVVFFDDDGLEILREQNIMIPKGPVPTPLNPDFRLRDYVELVQDRPKFFTRMYLRHLFNGLDIAFHDVYIKEFAWNRGGLTLLNYMLWISAFSISMLAVRRGFLQRNAVSFTLVALVCVPSLLSVAGAVETRFFLPLFLSVYTIVLIGMPDLLRRLHVERWYVKGLVAFTAIVLTLAARNLSHDVFTTVRL